MLCSFCEPAAQPNPSKSRPHSLPLMLCTFCHHYSYSTHPFNCKVMQNNYVSMNSSLFPSNANLNSLSSGSYSNISGTNAYLSSDNYLNISGTRANLSYSDLNICGTYTNQTVYQLIHI